MLSHCMASPVNVSPLVTSPLGHYSLMLWSQAPHRLPNDRLDCPARQPRCLLHYRNMDSVSFSHFFVFGYRTLYVIGCKSSHHMICNSSLKCLSTVCTVHSTLQQNKCEWIVFVFYSYAMAVMNHHVCPVENW